MPKYGFDEKPTTKIEFENDQIQNQIRDAEYSLLNWAE